jgi:hypothetical protein
VCKDEASTALDPSLAFVSHYWSANPTPQSVDSLWHHGAGRPKITKRAGRYEVRGAVTQSPDLSIAAPLRGPLFDAEPQTSRGYGKLVARC